VPVVFIEVQHGTYFGEDDIVRLEDDFGRRTSSVRIDELLAAGPNPIFEFFPPKSDAESATLAASLEDIKTLAPSFVSVTYRGGRESRQRTYDLVTQIEARRVRERDGPRHLRSDYTRAGCANL